jgi:ATP-dependent Lon protease
MNFSDHYFRELKIDLSKVFYIFTFNDISKINKVLLDRLNVIYIENPSKNDKLVILRDYCLNEITENIGITIPIIFDELSYQVIIEYTDSNIDLKISSGIRENVRILEKILLEINKEILLGQYETNLPLIINHNTFMNYFNKLKSQFVFLIQNNIPDYNMYI